MRYIVLLSLFLSSCMSVDKSACPYPATFTDAEKDAVINELNSVPDNDPIVNMLIKENKVNDYLKGLYNVK